MIKFEPVYDEEAIVGYTHRDATPEEIEAARKVALKDDAPTNYRSCWQCNRRHSHLILREDLLMCIMCDRFYVAGVDVTVLVTEDGEMKDEWSPDADVVFSDGTVHHVTGYYATEYHKNPELVGPMIERHFRDHTLKREIMRLRALVKSAYEEGQSSSESWESSNAKKELER
jgi:hypothetical protein